MHAPVPLPQASPDQLKRQFRRLALLYHPDKAGCSERFLAIRSAFEVLKDPAKRFKYDTTLLHMLDMQVQVGAEQLLLASVNGCRDFTDVLVCRARPSALHACHHACRST